MSNINWTTTWGSVSGTFITVDGFAAVWLTTDWTYIKGYLTTIRVLKLIKQEK